eukprot:2814524-Pleurochrysis_carterae.AAC.1
MRHSHFTRFIGLRTRFTSTASWLGYFESILDSATSHDTRQLHTRDSTASLSGRPRRLTASA